MVNKVYEALQAKEKMKQMVSSDASNAEALSVHGRTQNKSNDGYRGRGKSSNGYRDRSKSRGKGENSAGTAKRILILFLSVIN
jgi:hypothetical protein